MHLTGISRALYVAVCKDTDEIHIERVRADPAEGQRLYRQGETGDRRPAPYDKVSERSRLVGMPAVRAPRPLPRRPTGGAKLPDLPAFDPG